MKPPIRIFLSVLVAGAIALGLLATCGKKPAWTSAEPTPPAARIWTPEEMTSDPEGYLRWADDQITSQIQQREERRSALQQKRADIDGRREKFKASFEDIENLKQRMAAAVRRAEEEDRWPVVVAGRTIDKERAKAILEETGRYIEERRSLAVSYDEAVAKLDRTLSALNSDIARLGVLKDKLAVDLERVRVDRTNLAVEQMRTTEQEIAHYAKLLASMGEDAVGALPVPRTILPVDVQSMLK